MTVIHMYQLYRYECLVECLSVAYTIYTKSFFLYFIETGVVLEHNNIHVHVLHLCSCIYMYTYMYMYMYTICIILHYNYTYMYMYTSVHK